MTPAESVVMDWLLERGYTREQAARALVALTLPEPTPHDPALGWLRRSETARLGRFEAAWFLVEAERRGYLPKP